MLKKRRAWRRQGRAGDRAGQGVGQGLTVAGQNGGKAGWGGNLDNALNTRAIWVSSCQLGMRKLLVPIR